jgi:hypothetical protein
MRSFCLFRRTFLIKQQQSTQTNKNDIEFNISFINAERHLQGPSLRSSGWIEPKKKTHRQKKNTSDKQKHALGQKQISRGS